MIARGHVGGHGINLYCCKSMKTLKYFLKLITLKTIIGISACQRDLMGWASSDSSGWNKTRFCHSVPYFHGFTFQSNLSHVCVHPHACVCVRVHASHLTSAFLTRRESSRKQEHARFSVTLFVAWGTKNRNRSSMHT